jgi:integrase
MERRRLQGKQIHVTRSIVQIGWHTYSTLLRSTGAELEIMQELLRHSTIRVTLDTSTQAVTTEKRNAQEAVVELLFPEKKQET